MINKKNNIKKHFIYILYEVFFMVVINRKKIIFWAGIIATFMLLYSITAYNVNNTKNKTVATVALPVNNKVNCQNNNKAYTRIRKYRCICRTHWWRRFCCNNK